MLALIENKSPLDDKIGADRLATEDASSHDGYIHRATSKVEAEASTVNNPLTGIPKEELLRQVESIEEPSEEEKKAVAHEYARRWSHPLLLYMTIFTCSFGAATQGWDQTGSNGANLSFPQGFGIPESGPGLSEADAQKNQWIVGVVNAAHYIASALLGCWLSDPLNNWFVFPWLKLLVWYECDIASSVVVPGNGVVHDSTRGGIRPCCSRERTHSGLRF
ncbi:uncharacterized protein UBRO_20653 [Ustilago bromivora]|uniref:Uncharacterized protein n=1 Tax=Ustilago bromivora TaxID=307758 RepID=A0A1K0G487_9BASI|nr:uncharacterized protein UBRO_20653 [Ustilago bromivora]